MNRVVITGLGMVSPLGVGVEPFWQGLAEGRSAVREIQAFDASQYATRIGSEVTDFDPTDFIDRKEAKRMDRFTQFAMAAAILAYHDAGLDKQAVHKDELGVVLGTGCGGMSTLEQQAQVMLEKGPGRVSPFFVPMMISNIAAGQVAIQFGARGPNLTVVTACAASTNAIGEAFRYLQRGNAQVIMTGGSEASFTPLALAGFSSMRALSTRNDEPEKASRPFDNNRDGFVMGEGSCVLILETLASARRRGARVYGELIGYGCSADAYHITAPEPEGQGAVLAMQRALQDGGVEPEEVDYVNAHGTSTPFNDRIETMAIKKVFGDHAAKLMISSTKSMIGHLLGAGGAVELAATLLAMQRGLVPPTINYEQPDPDCDLDYVPNKARRARVTTALSNSFGFGGQNACLLVRSLAE
jgi:3-oxoacyl-[acyl-carrier-protein] synthase II